MPARKTWEYCYETLSAITGMSEAALRQHKRRGSFDPANLRSVFRFTVRHADLNLQTELMTSLSIHGKRFMEVPDVAERFRQQRRNSQPNSNAE